MQNLQYNLIVITYINDLLRKLITEEVANNIPILPLCKNSNNAIQAP